MATAVVFHEAIYNIGNGAIDLDSHTFKAVLTDSAPSQAGDDELADITQVSNGFGYTTGGVTLSGVTWAETGGGTGIWQWTVSDFSWTASGGTFGPFRYVVIYSDTSTGDKLLASADIGVSISISDGNMFTVDVGANGVFRIGAGTIS
jgi:hypothetical protein